MFKLSNGDCSKFDPPYFDQSSLSLFITKLWFRLVSANDGTSMLFNNFYPFWWFRVELFQEIIPGAGLKHFVNTFWIFLFQMFPSPEFEAVVSMNECFGWGSSSYRTRPTFILCLSCAASARLITVRYSTKFLKQVKNLTAFLTHHELFNASVSSVLFPNVSGH